MPAEIQLLPLGAIIQSFVVDGTNIVLGFPTQELYESHNSAYFGETIGRVGNRIKGGKIDSLNGKSYQLALNNGPNSLHGGAKGWGKAIWKGPNPVGIKTFSDLPLEGGESVTFTHRSEDGDENYPGTVDVTVTYTSGTQETAEGKEVSVLVIEYEATLVDGAEETAINMTNHSYFNLSGDATIEGTEAEVSTNLYLPVDDGGIPTGGAKEYSGIPAKKAFKFGATSPNPDDCFVFDAAAAPTVPIDTRTQELRRLIHASHPKTGIHLEVYSTEPSFQFYAGGFTDVPAVAGLPARKSRSAFCIEPQRYVNAVNVPEWRDQVILKKGEVYGSRTVYRGWSEKS